MKRKLSQIQAWRKMSAAFSDTFADWQGDLYVDFFDYRCYGLCHFIDSLYWDDFITGTVKSSMYAAFERKKRGKGYEGVYVWENDRKGMQARSRFCAKMADKLEQEKADK